MEPAYEIGPLGTKPEYRIVVVGGLWPVLGDSGATKRLLMRGWRLEPAERTDKDSEAPAAIICPTVASTDSPEHLPDIPVLTLGTSLIPGHLRMGLELPDTPPGHDLRLARLVATLGRTLNDDAIAEALSILPLFDDLAAPSAPRRTADTLCAASGLSEDVLSALHAAGVALAPDPGKPSAAQAVCGTEPALWGALACGREILCIGSSPLAGLGLTHDAPTPADVPAALKSLAAGRANHRDRARRALATEILFNSVPRDDADALAALIDAGLRAVVRPRRRSVSIVITNHNYRPYLTAAINSARHQTVPPKEIVVVDDGSTDGSAELISDTPGIISVLQPNRGQAAAFNAGFARTSGDIVLFLDADDCLLPEAVERIGCADQTGASRLFFGLEMIDRHGRVSGLYAPGTPTEPAASGMLAGAVAAHGIFPFVPTSGNAFPRRVLERLLPMPESEWRICADLWLVLAASALGEARELPEPLGQYRVHGRNAHFHDLGTEPHALKAHLKRRMVAWKGLLSHLPAGVPEVLAQTVRIGLHRCVTIAAAQAGRGHALRQVPQALRIAAASRDLAARARFSHALLPLRLALRRRMDRQRRFDLSDAGSLLDLAGPAGWPRLVPGDRADLAVPSPGAACLGRGWATPDGNGARLVDDAGTVAFRLPELSCHWRLWMGFEVDGDGPIRKLAVSLNGTAIDELDLHRTGQIDLRLARELLVGWKDVIGTYPHDGAGDGSAWQPRGNDPAACLTLRVDPADAGRLRLLSLRADVLTTTRAHAPSLAHGRFLSIAQGASDRQPLTCLGSGWGWSDGRGAALVGAGGLLSISLPRGGVHALTFVWQGARDSAAMARPADRVMVSLNDVLIPAHASPDGRQMTVELPDHAAFPEGRIRIALMAFADPVTGGWPDLLLTGLRLDTPGGTGSGEGRGRMLAPNVEFPAGPLVAAVTDGAAGLVADGEVARIAGDRFRLPLNLPRDHGPARLHVSLSAPDPVSGEFSLMDQRCEALLCSDNVISLEIPPDLSGDPVLEGKIGDPAHRCLLRSVRLVLQTPPWLASTDPAPPCPDQAAPADGIGPRDLFRLAADRADWHAPLDDALWMATQRAVLILPPLPCGTLAVSVSVLPMHAAGQRLRIEAGSAATQTEGPGLQTLRIALDAAAPAPRLTFLSSRLIASQAVDAGDTGMLGGAVIRIVPEVRAEKTGFAAPLRGRTKRGERQTPQEIAQDDAEHT